MGVRRLCDLAINSYTHGPKSGADLLQRAMSTLRYRMAGLGVPITLNEKHLLHFKAKHRGERAFIIGNGPSLNKCDLRALKGETTFGVNAIYLNRARMGFYPTYYVVEDDFVAEDRAGEINRLVGPTKFFGNYVKYCLRSSPDVIWINLRMNYGPYPGFPHFSRNAARMVWVGGTVAYVCLQLAYYMGVAEIYLIGFDHSYSDTKRREGRGRWDSVSFKRPQSFQPGLFWEGISLA